MQSCQRCGRTLPEDEPSCPECGTQPPAVDAARRAPLRALDSPRRDAAAPLVAVASAPTAGQSALQRNALQPVALAESGPRAERDADGAAVTVVGTTGTTGAGAERAPKPQPFGEERTGSQSRASGAWAKGRGEGAKILALRPEAGEARPEPHAEAENTSAPAPEAPPPDAPVSATDEAGRAPSTPTPSSPSQDAASSGVLSTRQSLQTASASGEHRRPPVLASESLRADLAPNVPGRGRIRVVALALGAAGAALVPAIAGLTPAALALAAAMALIAGLGAARLDYRRRASGLLALALPGLIASSVLAAPVGGPPHGALLALAVSGLAGALYFRARYRASLLARGLVAAWVVVGAAWLLSSHVFADLGAVEAAWQSWLPTVVAATLAPLLALALLSFMTHTSTGGCAAWATTLLAWLAVYEVIAYAATVFPAGAPAWTGGWRLGVALGAVATPMLATVTAIAVAQLLVVASGGGREEKPA